MSLIPYLLDEMPSTLMDQRFGMTLAPSDLLTAMMAPLVSRDYYRPWRHLDTLSRDVGSTIKSDKDKFQVNLDVQHFAPEEISVKTADGYIVVEGKHKEKQDEHGYVSRQFMRRYALPRGCTAETVQSSLSSDGVLIVTAPRQTPPELKGESHVAIQKTGPAKKQLKSFESEVPKPTEK